MHLTFLDRIPIVNPVYESCFVYLGALDRTQLSINLVLFPFENPNQPCLSILLSVYLDALDTTFQYI